MPRRREKKLAHPLTEWKRRHRRNRTRMALLEADWPGMQETCEKIADTLSHMIKPQELAAVAIDGIFEKAFEAYLGILGKPSHTDHERLVAFMKSAFATLREETGISGIDDELVRRFVRQEFWWILIPERKELTFPQAKQRDGNADPSVSG
jgi:hypothetical protein